MVTPLSVCAQEMEYLVIESLDVTDQDLLSHLDECFAFIDAGIKEAHTGVLVHWYGPGVDLDGELGRDC